MDRAPAHQYLLLLQPLHGLLELPLLLAGLGDGRLVLLLVRHGDHSQDEVDQVEGAQENHHHEKHHVGLPGRTQRLEEEKACECVMQHKHTAACEAVKG